MTDPPTDVLRVFESIAQRFFARVERIEVVAGSADLARVEEPGGVWCLRRWPEGMTVERIAFVHEALRLAREADLAVVPEVAIASERTVAHPKIIAAESGLYDVQSWMPGQVAVRRAWVALDGGTSVDLPGDLPDRLVLETTGLMAQFHAGTIEAASMSNAPVSPLRGFGAAANRVWRQRLRELDPLAPKVPAVREWRAAARRVVAPALERIEEAGAAGQSAEVVIHAGLWPSHVLASRSGRGNVVTGIVDWTDAIVSSPLVDIAQLIVHFGGWTPESAEAVINAYHETRPLPPAERRLLPAVAALEVTAQTGRLLRAGYAAEVQLDGGERSLARNGARAMITSLETLANVIEYGETRPPRQFKKWVHRRPAANEAGRRKGGRRG